MYHPTVQAEGRTKLDAMIASRLPFAEIEKLPKPRIQELLGRQSSRTVALALIGADGEMKLVRANTSKAKGEQLALDFVLMKRQLDEATIEVEDVIEAKRALSEEARRILEADAELAARGQARSGARPIPARR
jgi:hypothetical protein